MTTEIIERPEGGLPMATTAGELSARLIDMRQQTEHVQAFFRDVMVGGQDYGVIPGTQKPTLLKPGAEKLCELYGYAIAVAETRETMDETTGFYRVVVTVRLTSKRHGGLVAEGVGEANTKEGRYRWRTAQRLCPSCGTASIIVGKPEYGGGFVCFAKKGGCGAKFTDDDQRITGQQSGQIENDDPWTLWNTVLKMAKKRALVDAALSATRSSGMFTQDVEDLHGWIDGTARHIDEPPREPRPTNGQQRPQQQPQRPQQGAGPKPVSDAQKNAIHKLLAALKGKNPQVHDKIIAGAVMQYPDLVNDDGALVLTVLTSQQASAFMDLIGAAMRESNGEAADPDDLPFE